MHCFRSLGLASVLVVATFSTTSAKDYFLTIGGGYSPSGNQASLEKNVLFFQRLLKEQSLDQSPLDIYFSDGEADGRDLQVNDPNSVPAANRLMAEFFGNVRTIGMHYRNHAVPGIRGATSPENIALWFKQVGRQMQSGDRLVIYVTSHGGQSATRDNPHDTTIYLWNNNRIKMSEFVGHLDTLPTGVSVVTVMVQCHAGGFARLLFNHGNPDDGPSQQNRCGFFATVHSRPAAGCTPDINEANYQEYSSFFWAAIGGVNRLGETIEPPDYDGDGAISFDESHAYTVLTSNTIDLPIKTSGEFLRVRSQFKDDDHSNLLAREIPYDELIALASTSDRAVLDGLSESLELSGDDRISAARAKVPRRSGRSGRSGRTRPSGTRGRGGRGATTASPTRQLQQKIAGDLKKRWPELNNVLHPAAVELVTTRADQFVEAVENHPDYAKYRRLTSTAASSTNSGRTPVKFERFLRTAENVILAENLRRLGNADHLNTYHRIVTAERGKLK